jgi:hypothetical protein
VQSSCPPSAYRGSPDALYHNNGDGTFTNVTVKAKIYQPEGKNLSVGATDYDNDGFPDLFVANDGLRAYLYHNQHDGTFKEIGLDSGMAFTGQGVTMAAMCISLGDFNNDGWFDLYISDFQRSSDHVWQNDGKGFFDEVSDQSGLTRATHDVLRFGGGFFDYDNDGWLDIFIANGHVYPEVEQATPGIRYKQLNSLFHNEHNGKFVDVSKSSGNGFQTPHVGRGVAFADFDNDGFVDVVVANRRCASAAAQQWRQRKSLSEFQVGGHQGNGDAMGSANPVMAGGISQIREIEGGGSYLSQSDLRANSAWARPRETVEVKWPSGLRKPSCIDADKLYLIQEGSERIEVQKFARQPPRPAKRRCALQDLAQPLRHDQVLPGCSIKLRPRWYCCRRAGQHSQAGRQSQDSARRGAPPRIFSITLGRDLDPALVIGNHQMGT